MFLVLLDNTPEGTKRLSEYIKRAGIPTTTNDHELYELGK